MRAILLIGANFARTQWLAVAILTAYLAGIGVLFGWNEPRPDARFFLEWHSFYLVLLGAMIALPALWSERRSRRIVAVLSKGIARWQYLGGILCGCTIISAWFCLLVGAITAWLCRAGEAATDGLAALIVVLFLCCVTAASAALFCSVFLHPLPAAIVTSGILFLPLATEIGGWYPPGEFFPVSAVLRVIKLFQFRPPGTGIWGIAAGAVLETIFFWAAASVIFLRRDVTTSPE
jgi:ABC-type transport system involved in multi-copper enzyme maturation permease subunit